MKVWASLVGAHCYQSSLKFKRNQSPTQPKLSYFSLDLMQLSQPLIRLKSPLNSVSVNCQQSMGLNYFLSFFLRPESLLFETLIVKRMPQYFVELIWNPMISTLKTCRGQLTPSFFKGQIILAVHPQLPSGILQAQMQPQIFEGMLSAARFIISTPQPL